MKTKDQIVLETHPIIHPHSILSFLFNEVGVEIPEAEIRGYWDDAYRFRRPWAPASPSRLHVPLAMYGDSARTVVQYKFEKVTGLTVNGLVEATINAIQFLSALQLSYAKNDEDNA